MVIFRGILMIKCINRCEFQHFEDDVFYCNLYEIYLSAIINDNNKIEVHRCSKCVKEAVIGTDSKDEFVRKIKQHLGWLMDSFYSLKDDMEQEVTHLYRIIKDLEEDETVCFSKTIGDRRRQSNDKTEEI